MYLNDLFNYLSNIWNKCEDKAPSRRANKAHLQIVKAQSDRVKAHLKRISCQGAAMFRV